jgi:hypothetical protein
MKPKFRAVLLTISAALFFANAARAWPDYGMVVYGESYAAYDPGTNEVYGYASTYSTWALVRADPYVNGADGWHVFESQEEYVYAEADFSFTPNQNGYYTAWGQHFYWTGSPAWWQPDGWSGSDNVYARPVHITAVCCLGLLSGSAVRGSSGSLAIYGDDLTSYWGQTSVSIDGVSTYLTYADPNTLKLNFTIPSDAATGDHNLTVATFYGSDSTNFVVGDPTPRIDSISGPWEVGGTWNFTVDGAWFGSAPSIQIGGIEAETFGINSSTDTHISAWVDLTYLGGGTATVYVASNGYGGNSFMTGTGGPEVAN